MKHSLGTFSFCSYLNGCNTTRFATENNNCVLWIKIRHKNIYFLLMAELGVLSRILR